MRKQLVACNGRPDITDSTPEGTTAGGGSVTHTDSLKTISPTRNGISLVNESNPAIPLPSLPIRLSRNFLPSFC